VKSFEQSIRCVFRCTGRVFVHLYCNMFLSLSFFFSCLLFVPEIVAISLFALVQRNVFIPFELFFSSLSFTNVFELLQDYLNHNRSSLLSFFYYYKIIDSLLLPSIFCARKRFNEYLFKRPLVFLANFFLFLRRKIVLDVERLANFRRRLPFDHIRDGLAAQIEQILDVQVVRRQDELKQRRLIDFHVLQIKVLFIVLGFVFTVFALRVGVVFAIRDDFL